MSLTPFDAALELRPQPSRLLIRTLFLLHALAAAVALLAIHERGLAVLLFVAVLLSAYYCYQRYWLRGGARNIRRVLWRAEGDWVIERNNLQRFQARLLPNSYLHPRLVILQFELQRGGRQSLLLLPDSLDYNTLRRLRARLRVERQTLVEQGV